jgi:hypothetical protein
MFRKHASRALILLFALLSLPASAQTTAATLFPAHPTLVMSQGTGGIILPELGAWRIQRIDIYDEGTRPTLLLTNSKTAITASFLLFPNHSGHATADGCRDDAIQPIVDNMGKQITARKDDSVMGSEGQMLSSTSYQLALPGTKLTQHNLFAFTGNATVCIELHISSAPGRQDDAADFKSALADFHPVPDYTPAPRDLIFIAHLLEQKTPLLAVPYYKASLPLLPPGPESLTLRRVAIDQIVIDLGMAGDLADSRGIASDAIRSDPDYPFNYYNLACNDAESGDAANARIHLQQAFDRKANTLPGESLPDPTKDPSLQKLKNNSEFWAFVQSLK